MFFLTLSAKALCVLSVANRYNFSVFNSKRTYDGFLHHHTRLEIDWRSDDAVYCEMTISTGAGFRLPNMMRHGTHYEWVGQHFTVKLNAIPKVYYICRYYQGRKQGIQETFAGSNLAIITFYQNGNRDGYEIDYARCGGFVRYFRNGHCYIAIPWEESPIEVIEAIEEMKAKHPKLFQE
jgi:hypothetical protein